MLELKKTIKMNIDLVGKRQEENMSDGSDGGGKDPVKILLIFILVIVLAWMGILLFKKINLDQENDRLKSSIILSSKKIREIVNSDDPAKKIMVSKIVKNAKEKRIIWSKMMADIINLKTSGISFVDFSSTNKGEIKALISAKNISAITQFVASLNANEKVDKVVINSIGMGNILFGSSLEVDINFNLNI